MWKPAEEIASDSTETFAEVLGMSCVTDDDCVMVGYLGFSTRIAAVAEKIDGDWGPLQQNVGLSTIAEWDPAASASATSVSCMPSGECVVVGSLGLTAGGTTGYVATRKNGSWSAIVIPGLATLSTENGSPTPNPSGTNLRVSCDATGRCAAGGRYTYGAANNLFGAWVAQRDTNGAWSSAIDVPGVPDLNAADNANLTRLSCPGGGNCVAIGTYGASNIQAFIVELVNGVWGQAFPVPGLLPPGGLNQGAVSFEGLDCATFNDCAASGRGGLFGGFVVNKVGGIWGSAIAVPGLATANNVALQHLSCPAAGACALTAANLTTNVAYLASQVGGTWQAAQEMTFAPGLDAVHNAMRGISCSAPGECIAVGIYRTSDFSTFQAWQAVQSGGVWAEADAIPGMADLLTNPPSRSHGQVVDCVVGAGCNVGGVTFFGGASHRFFAASLASAPASKTVTFNANDGTDTMAAQVASSNERLQANVFEREGFFFRGWNTAADGSGTQFRNRQTYNFASDLTLYAIWEAVEERPAPRPPASAPVTPSAPGKSTVVDEAGGVVEVVMAETVSGQTSTVGAAGNTGFSVSLADDGVRSGFGLQLEGVDRTGQAVELAEGRLVLAEDRRVAASGDGFAPRAPVAFYLVPEEPIGALQLLALAFRTTSVAPILLETTFVDGDGKFEGTLELPQGLDSGDYLLQAVGAVSSGEILTVTLGLRVEVAGSVAAPTYSGPTVTAASNRIAVGGDTVFLSGTKLSEVERIVIGGVSASFSVLTDGRIELMVPSGLSAGLYDVVLSGSFGTLRVQGLLTIRLATTSVDSGAWTQLRPSGTSVSMFSKNPMGVGKVQFMVNGRERAWVRAIDETDAKLRFRGSAHYLMRSVDLEPGKNVFEIYVDGRRVWRAAYTLRP